MGKSLGESSQRNICYLSLKDRPWFVEERAKKKTGKGNNIILWSDMNILPHGNLPVYFQVPSVTTSQ